MNLSGEKRFDFGVNWQSYSQSSLTPEHFERALESLKSLFQLENFGGGSFLDVGCGSGIFSIAAKRLGAGSVLGVDISEHSVRTSAGNAKAMNIPATEIRFEQMDVLDGRRFDALGQYDYVYAWGSLHHTGCMWEAIDAACRRVKPGGVFALAIYNRNFSSGFWKQIKRFYNQGPRVLQKPMIAVFGGMIFAGKWIYTRQDPRRMHRGMDFYHDVVDWVGGYPYEYASRRQVIEHVAKHGFIMTHCVPAHIPLANNQFVFRRQ
ncbi:MAG: class I SAM-dependent methyltransferase [Candidatus Omnitrophota bacterium]